MQAVPLFDLQDQYASVREVVAARLDATLDPNLEGKGIESGVYYPVPLHLIVAAVVRDFYRVGETRPPLPCT